MDGGNYIKEGRDSAKSTCLMFSPKEEAVGALANSLKLFEVQYYDAYDFKIQNFPTEQ
jgi:phenylalanine-4-hydroxylase